MEEFNRQRTELYNQSYKNKVDAKKIHHDMIQNEKDKLIELASRNFPCNKVLISSLIA